MLWDQPTTALRGAVSKGGQRALYMYMHTTTTPPQGLHAPPTLHATESLTGNPKNKHIKQKKYAEATMSHTNQRHARTVTSELLLRTLYTPSLRVVPPQISAIVRPFGNAFSLTEPCRPIDES